MNIIPGVDTFRQLGTGASTRSFKDKLRDTISVFDFMTSAEIADVSNDTASLDVTAACQAAIDASYHKRLLWPKGTYKITSTLTAAIAGFIDWEGEVYRETIIDWYGGASPIIYIETETQPSVSNLCLQNHGTATVGIQCDGLFATFNRLWIIPAVRFTVACIQSRTDNPVESWSFRDIYIGGSHGQRSERGIYIHTGNNISFDHCEFDDVENGVVIGKTGGSGTDSGLVRNVSFGNGCFFQMQETNLGSPISIDLVYCQGGSIIGNYFVLGEQNHRSIKFREAGAFLVAGNIYDGVGLVDYAIDCLDANTKNVTIQNNYYWRIALAGAHITAGTDIWVDNNKLDICPAQAVQTNNSFTPALKFGGASVDMTYAANGQVGVFYRRENKIFFEGTIVLTAKGSSTGAVTVTGLPKAASTNRTNLTGTVTIFGDNLTSLTGGLVGIIVGGETAFRVYDSANGTAAQLTHANFNNSSYLYFSGQYDCVDG